MRTQVIPGQTVRVADEVWIAAALLHMEQPGREDFAIEEILARVAKENITGELRPGVMVHAYLHCVANRAPNPTGYRMLFATGQNTRRLYRLGDRAHPLRKGKITPRRDQIPVRYEGLLKWYETEYIKRGPAPQGALDSVLALRGLGSEIWQGVDPDEYVRQLREGWE